MPRYIDADKLRKDVLDLPNCYNGFSDTYDKAMIIDLVDEQPTVDVVRCKDCKWHKESKYSELRPMRFCYRLRNDDGVPVGYNWDENDFCSYGERKEDGERMDSER